MDLNDADARLVLWLTEQPHDGVTGSIVDRLAHLRNRLYDSLAPSEPEEHLPEVQPEADEMPEEHIPEPEPQAEEIPEEADAEAAPTNGTYSPPWVVPPAVPAEPVAAEA